MKRGRRRVVGRFDSRCVDSDDVEVVDVVGVGMVDMDVDDRNDGLE
jgi:hypothetical protein